MGHLRLKESFLTNSKEPGKQAIRPAGIQEHTDMICRRLYWLEDHDRLLLEMIYEKGLSCRQIASITNRRASSISRRVQKLTGRLLGREYPICLSYRRELSRLQLKIARDRFVADLSRPAIARRHGISLYRVDCHLRCLRKLLAKHTPAQTKIKLFYLREGA